MKERDGDADAVLLSVVKGLGEELAVVDDVVVREHDALGQAGGAGGVLDVGDVLRVDMIGKLARCVEKNGPLWRIKEDDVAQIEREAAAGAFEDGSVVGAAVVGPEKERLHA